MTDLRRNPAMPWADPVKSVLDQLRQRGASVSGFNAVIHNTIPVDAGLNARPSLAVAAALTVRELFPFGLSETGLTAPPQRDRKGKLPPLPAAGRLPLATLCHAAERESAGVFSDLADTIASLCGKAWSVMSIDGHARTVEQTILTGEAIVICPAGLEPAPASAEHDGLRRHCESAAQKLGVKTLAPGGLETTGSASIEIDAPRI